MATNRSAFELLLDKYEPVLKAAFLDAIADIRSQVTLKLLVERLERGDVAGAIDVLQIERSAFGPLELAFAEAYNAGGMDLANGLKLRDPQGQRVLFRFGVRNPEAEAWLAQHSATLVTRIVEDQRQGIRTALAEGLARGDNPRRTALDVVGRVSRVTGERDGGIIGLTAPQERFVASARQELSAGDYSAYLTRERRDHRFDRTIAAAIKSGKPLDRATVDRIVGRYGDRLLELRADVLAMDQTFTALSKSKADAVLQAVRAGKVDASFVTKRWRHSGKANARHDHRRLNGTEVGFFEDFVMGDGTRVAYPHAPGTPAKHTLGCGCDFEIRIDYTGQFLARRAA